MLQAGLVHQVLFPKVHLRWIGLVVAGAIDIVDVCSGGNEISCDPLLLSDTARRLPSQKAIVAELFETLIGNEAALMCILDLVVRIVIVPAFCGMSASISNGDSLQVDSLNISLFVEVEDCLG
jgi:hypothetical protein